MACCVRNIPTKNYQNLIIGFQVTVKNVGDAFWDTLYKRKTIQTLSHLIGARQADHTSCRSKLIIELQF